MKNIYKSLVCAVAGLSTLAACESFDSINTNPNAVTPASVDPELLLPQSLICATLNADQYQRVHNLYVDTYCQYFANDHYDSNVCVPVDAFHGSFYWNYFWGWIRDLNEIIRLTNEDITAENGRYVNLNSIARIWKVYCFHQATDLFGDLPYFNAANGSGIAPDYDSQKEIYMDMIKELREAAAAISLTGSSIKSSTDFVNGANMLKWKQFANLMRLRLAMRMSEADPDNAKKLVEEAANAEGGFPTENITIVRKDNYYVISSPGNSWYNPTAYLWNGGRMTMSTSMEKILTGLGGIEFPGRTTVDYYNPDSIPEFVDPRGPIYFNVTNKYTVNDANSDIGKQYIGTWTGVMPGLTIANAKSIPFHKKNHARLGAWFRDAGKDPDSKTPGQGGTLTRDNPLVLAYTSEADFILAEAACRGWNVGGDAKTFYESGIRKSMAEVEIPADKVEAYLKSDMKNGYGVSVKFEDTDNNRNTQLDKIITQKYLANFPYNGYEAWNDYRRLGIPTLDPFVQAREGYVEQVGAMDFKGSLRRIPYPNDESTKDAEKYQAQLAKMPGGDKTTTRMWWDARTTLKE